MNIHFEKIDKTDLEAFERLAEWDNLPHLEPFVKVNFIEGPYLVYKGDELMKSANNPPTRQWNAYFIKDGEKYIGEISLDIDPEHLDKKIPNSGWLGILIADTDYHGRGVGEMAMEFIENRARELNLVRIELGVFEYNERAIAFYEKLGYRRFHVNENFTFFNGKWYDDYRMDKNL